MLFGGSVGARAYGSTMAVQVEAHIRQRTPEVPDGTLGETRSVTVDAASFDDAKQQVLDQLPGADWIVLSWRVSRWSLSSGPGLRWFGQKLPGGRRGRTVGGRREDL